MGTPDILVRIAATVKEIQGDNTELYLALISKQGRFPFKEVCLVYCYIGCGNH